MKRHSFAGTGEVPAGMQRRKFIGIVAASASVVGIAASCSKDDDGPRNPGVVDGKVFLGTGDIGVLNYAYALEQLEAAFYLQVIATPYSGMTPRELALLTDVRDHEVAHREFFKAALGTTIIPGLTPDFSTIDFSSRESVLATAKTYEDLGVSAYNGAGKLFVSGDYLLLAGKIVSVEARHAAYIRDLISYGSFADSTTVNAMGLDVANDPSVVLPAVQPFIKETIDGSGLPTS